MKKLVRSVELLMPHVADKRYDLQQQLLRRMGKPWRPDVLGLKHLVTPSPLIVDIGANRGFFLSAMETIAPQAKLVAFEPFPRLASLLRQRMQARGVRVEPVGLGAERSQLPLYVPVYRGMPLDTLASMHYEEAAGWLTADRIHWFDASKLKVEKFVVDVRPLDDYGLAPDVVKMYAQRFEPEIVAGGRKTLTEHQPVVLAPSHFPAGDKALREIGYERYGYADGTFIREGEGDYFSWYMTPKSLARLNARVVDAPGSVQAA
jgi:FkbM family methyltransferase